MKAILAHLNDAEGSVRRLVVEALGAQLAFQP